jgi:uncharacterized membrane protein YedE/YeeE
MAFTWDVFLMAAGFGLLYGFLLQKADFCFVASIRDWISVRDRRILNGVLVLIGVALLGWGITLTLGLADLSDVWTVPIGGANLLGGIIFGIGMTLAGGCGSGTLYRCGMGYVQFWLVLLCAIIGNLLFAWIYDPWARDYMLEPITVTEQGFTLFSLPLPYLLIPSVIVFGTLAVLVFRKGAASLWLDIKSIFTDWERNPFRQSHWDIRFVAICIGVIATVQFVLMSNVSITGPETRMGAVILSWIFGEEIIYNNTYLNGLFADFPNIGFGPEEALIFFLILGSFLAAWFSGSFKWRIPRKSRLPYAIIGGLIMGIGSRIAPGCNIANVITGVGGLSIHSVITIAGMMIGIFIVVAYVFKMPLMLFNRESNHD